MIGTDEHKPKLCCPSPATLGQTILKPEVKQQANNWSFCHKLNRKSYPHYGGLSDVTQINSILIQGNFKAVDKNVCWFLVPFLCLG